MFDMKSMLKAMGLDVTELENYKAEFLRVLGVVESKFNENSERMERLEANIALIQTQLVQVQQVASILLKDRNKDHWGEIDDPKAQAEAEELADKVQATADELTAHLNGNVPSDLKVGELARPNDNAN